MHAVVRVRVVVKVHAMVGVRVVVEVHAMVRVRVVVKIHAVHVPWYLVHATPMHVPCMCMCMCHAHGAGPAWLLVLDLPNAVRCGAPLGGAGPESRGGAYFPRRRARATGVGGHILPAGIS